MDRMKTDFEMKAQSRHGARGRSGSTLIEFVLAGSFIFVPLLVGAVAVGMSMIRSIQVTGLNRDAGHLFSSGVDFSQTVNQNLLVKIAGDLNITPTGGDGVVILSEIVGTGPNQATITTRQVIGNASLRASSYGTPDTINSSGNVTADSSAVAVNFTPAVIPMVSGQIAYVAETYFSTTDYNLGGMMPNGIYVWTVF
jgi:hypothetical protein